MFTKVMTFFKPPEYDSIEQTQKARFVHYSLMVTFVACILLGFLNMPGKMDLNVFLFVVSGVSFLCIPANKRGYYLPVTIFMSGLILVLITYSLLAGVGLKDAALVTYPLFIIFTSYLLNKRTVFLTTLLSIGAVVLVYYLERGGHYIPAVYSDVDQLKVILVLFPAAGFLFWAVIDNWENILKDLEETYDLTLSGWGQALEFRDHETEGHSQHVVEMTIALAKRLGISGRELDLIRRGALLHDIGKMAVPDAILLKKSGLTEEEWKVVKMHPLRARDLLKDIPYLRVALDIPYSHHERWDGSGYPEGLSREEIPFEARIFAVVDVWDALTSDRPYRQRWLQDKAREYIQDQAGKQFDPKVVQAFLELMESQGMATP